MKDHLLVVARADEKADLRDASWVGAWVGMSVGAMVETMVVTRVDATVAT